MIRHISVFFLKEDSVDFKKAANIKKLEELLLEIPKKMEGIADYKVGINSSPLLPKGILEVPEFGDIVQIIDFNEEEAAKGYPRHPAHVEFIKQSKNIIEKVVAIDYVW